MLLKLLALLVIIVFTIFYLYKKTYHIKQWNKDSIDQEVKKSVVPVIIYTVYDEKYSNKPFVQLNKKIIEKYSQHHNNEYRPIIDDTISPYWLRVKHLLHILNNSVDGTLVMYLDADAIPAHYDISVSSFVDSLNVPNLDIIISEDPLSESNVAYPGKYNTGVFIVRNTPSSREFVNKWMSMYDDNKWKNKNGSWSCTDMYLPCLYSAINYEQGAFTYLSKDYKNIIKDLRYTTLASNVKNKDSFVLHFMGENDTQRHDKMAEIYTEIPSEHIQLKKEVVIYSGLNV